MRSNSLNRYLVIAVLSAVAVGLAITDTLRRASAYVVDGIKAFAHAVAKVTFHKPDDLHPASLLVAAKRYAQRTLQRGERPMLSPTWRMCPSI